MHWARERECVCVCVCVCMCVCAAIFLQDFLQGLVHLWKDAGREHRPVSPGTTGRPPGCLTCGPSTIPPPVLTGRDVPHFTIREARAQAQGRTVSDSSLEPRGVWRGSEPWPLRMRRRPRAGRWEPRAGARQPVRAERHGEQGRLPGRPAPSQSQEGALGTSASSVVQLPKWGLLPTIVIHRGHGGSLLMHKQ